MKKYESPEPASFGHEKHESVPSLSEECESTTLQKNIFETFVGGSSKTASDTSDTSDTSDSRLIPLENPSSPYANLILTEELPNLGQKAYYCKEHPSVPAYYDLEGIIESHFKVHPGHEHK